MNDITVRRPIKWLSCGETNVGTVRKINEDSILSKPEERLWVVADGMGGYEAGDIASSMTVNSIDATQYNESLEDTVLSIENNLLAVNQKILDYSYEMCNQNTIGTTVVSLVIRDRVGACIWAGDSRLYRYRNGQLQQVSRDHSHVEELIEQGLLSKEEAENHPDSNVITRAIGANEYIEIDVIKFDTQVGDTFLLCSDGLYNAVSLDDIVTCLNGDNIEKIVQQLLSIALDNKASDNVSIIVARGESEKLARNRVSAL
ncbi:MAG: PP2C family serine/threonine-protein phosphatase [Thiohalomonadales bacterium]